MIEIEQYNYMDNAEIADNILVEVESMDNRQRLALHDMIQKIKRNSDAERTGQHMKWFDEAILPPLQEFAQNTSRILRYKEIQRVLSLYVYAIRKELLFQKIVIAYTWLCLWQYRFV